ncbi:MAG TPA: DNA polymerase, partial [Candidatus Thioglobus sp.]|nr:DNA polymerase [Candidatus Thioglobus sp.]
INTSKKNLMDSEDMFWEKKYPAFIVNKCLSAHPDSLFYVNEMNRLNFLDKRLQYDFLINSLSKRKRFAKWMRSTKVKNIDLIKLYYGFSNEKAKQALDILTADDIEIIKTKLNTGGKHGRTGVDT